MDESKKNKKETVAFLLFLFLLICAQADQSIMIPNFLLIMKELNLNEQEIGLINSAFLYISSFVMIIWGYLSDKIERKPLVMAGTLIWAIASLLTYFTPLLSSRFSFYYLLIIRMITGFGVGSLVPVGFSIMGDLFPPKKRGKAFTFFGISLGVGASFGMVLAAVIPSWRVPFVVLAIPSILAIVLFYIFIPEVKRAEKEEEFEQLISEGIEYSYRIKMKDIVNIFKSKSYVFLLLQGIPGTIPFTIFNYWFPTYLQKSFQFTKFASTVSLIGFAILGVVGYISGGILTDFFTKKKYYTARVIIALISVLVPIPFYIISLNIPLSNSFGAGKESILDILFKIILHPQFLFITAFMGIAFFIQNLIGPVFYTCVADLNLPERRGTAVSFMNVVEVTGRGIAPYLGGVLSSYFGIKMAILYGLSFWILCAIFWIPLFKYLPVEIENIHKILSERANQIKR